MLVPRDEFNGNRLPVVLPDSLCRWDPSHHSWLGISGAMPRISFTAAVERPLLNDSRYACPTPRSDEFLSLWSPILLPHRTTTFLESMQNDESDSTSSTMLARLSSTFYFRRAHQSRTRARPRSPACPCSTLCPGVHQHHSAIHVSTHKLSNSITQHSQTNISSTLSRSGARRRRPATSHPRLNRFTAR